jgi:transcription initiation factor TFIIB
MLYIFMCIKMELDVKLNKVLTYRSKDDMTVRQTSACPLCRSESLITDAQSGEVICSTCGMVISDKIQETKPRRLLYSDDISKEGARTGMPTSLAQADMGLSTVISRSDKDAGGCEIEPSMVSRMHRLRTWDFRTQVSSGSHQNLRYAFRELNTLRINLVYLMQ